MQPDPKSFDREILALAQETHRVAETIADRAIGVHLFAIADAVLRLAYLGDSSNREELAEALARLGPDWHHHAPP